MKKFIVSEMHFNSEDLLGFWQQEHGNLNFNRRKEFLELQEVRDLVGISKPFIISAVGEIYGKQSKLFQSIDKQKHTFSMDFCRLWKSDTHYLLFDFSFHSSDDKFTNWEPAPIHIRINWLRRIWEQHYGELSRKHSSAFMNNAEVNSIVEYRLGDVLVELHKNKKVKAILENLKNNGCSNIPELDNQLTGAEEINLKNDALRAENLFRQINRVFEVEIELRKNQMKNMYMDFSSSKFAPTTASRNEHLCTSCGANIGLFNNHIC
jgi:hypothetical protein